MVKKILQFLHGEVTGVHLAAYLLGFFAICSQILALLRDKLLAFTFGAGHSLDVYYAAFRIPDFLFITIGSVVSLSILIPFLITSYEKGAEYSRKFIDSVFTFFLFAIVLVSAVVYLLAPTLINKLFPGFSSESITGVVHLTRILLLSPVLLGISNLFGSLTQSKNRFVVYAISPLLYNIGIIVGVFWFYPFFGLTGVAWGVILGALMHLLIQVPTTSHLGLLPRITFKPSFTLVKEVVIVSLPRTITLSISHVAIFFIISIASFMSAGSIAIFNLAFNLQSVPLSIFGVSYSMAAFPALSRFANERNVEAFRDQFVNTAKHIMFWVVPSSVVFVVLRAHIVRLVLGAGEFDWTDTRLTAAVLALFAISLTLQALTLLFVRALYASGVTGKPFYVTMVSGTVMVLSSYFLVQYFNANATFKYFVESILKIPEVGGTEVTMLGLGFTLGSLLEGIFVWILFTKFCKGFTKPIIDSFFKIFGSSVIMGFVIFLALRFFNLFFSLDTFLGVFMQTILSAICGVLALVAMLVLLKSDELADIVMSLKERFWRVKAVSPDSELV